MSTLETFDHAQVLPPFAFQLPTRMTAIASPDGVALISPVPIDDTLAARIARLGEVRWLIAPNLLHSSYMGAAQQRYPRARVLAPRKLKRRGFEVDAALEEGLPAELPLTMIPIEGAPQIDEFTFFHDPTRTLIVTDFVFHMVRPRGWFANLAMHVVGCHGCLAMSRTWRLFARDRAQVRASVERMLALPVETLVMAHGELVREDAHARLASAASWLLPRRVALPA
ncbi:MAG TPA: hypothetical protein VFX59_08470 [Polyangiales bacterium]|nr:hypothetical protein [Polyangiales bacterium]